MRSLFSLGGYTAFSLLCVLTFAAPSAQAGLFGSDEKESVRQEAAPPANAPRSFADLSETLLPAVVNISSTTKVSQPSGEMPEMPEFPEGSPFNEFFKDFMERHGQGGMGQGQALPSTSLGSGFVIDAKKGLIVTNNHVIKDADEIRVIFNDDETLDAELVGTDDKTDLAVLKVDPSKRKLAEVPFGNSDVMRVGDWVVAIGNPFGLGGTVTAGIISARQRDIHSGPYDDFIQTDASINRGNSGGPMFNLKGEVIGINTAIYSPSGGSVGIGFAIPSDLAKPVINQIVEFGRTRRGWLGVKIQTITEEIAESMGLDETGGALVASVTADGPADKAKMMQGDVIVEFNGHKLSTMRQLPRIVAETPVGEKVPVKVIRDGKEKIISVVVGELEKAEDEGLLVGSKDNSVDPKGGKASELDGTGVVVSAITPSMREMYSIPDSVDGLVVTKVDARSDAAMKGLVVGDVILEINQVPVVAVDEAQEQIEEIMADKSA
ncbi:MAG TPA: DegQ family serine endoprotease, partial [Alphaproteobacteria bacterium]|nr:DegQ family serine endoprotease [Alphaproteobacteria bacterium]